MDRSLERLLLREGVMHGWGHAQDKGVTHLNLGNVPESQTDSSGFPTFSAQDTEGLGGGDGFAAGCHIVSMASVGKSADAAGMSACATSRQRNTGEKSGLSALCQVSRPFHHDVAAA